MAISSVAAAYTTPGDGPGPDEAGGAMIHAADKYSRDLGARASASTGMRATRQSGASDSGRRSLRDVLPEGYMPVREVKNMALLGRWPLLDDGMSACMPTKVVSAMQRRSFLGDDEADAWLGLHARACAGDPEAQRAFGRVCENGAYRAEADVQRAFFWYYRAGLQGDLEARQNAERLMHKSQHIAAETMAEPALIYPGRWRINAHLSPQLISASVFELFADGSANGSLLGHSRIPAGTPIVAPESCEEEAADAPVSSARLSSNTYRGGWAFDGIGQVLTIIFESESGERRWRSASWQIELTGCKEGSLFGRDRRMVGYTLERVSEKE